MDLDPNILNPQNVAEEIIEELGFDPKLLEISSREVLSALIRRTAGLICPCTKRRIQKTVLNSLNGLVNPLSDIRESVDELIDLLIANGDLLEQNDIMSDLSRNEVIIYLAPLSFVKRASGACILLGISPDDRQVLSDYLIENVQYNDFSRILSIDLNQDMADYLQGIGFIELPYKAWVKCPPPMTAEKTISIMDMNLGSYLAHSSETIEGLRIIDHSIGVEYYPGRWVCPNEQTGKYVGRRPQAYGADLWCYVELENGKPRRFLDLPLIGSKWRGCDEAWRLQAAIDHCNKKPQKYRLRSGTGDFKIIDLFSPVPSWIQRRWTMIGLPITSYKCLLSFRFRTQEIEEEIAFAKEQMWLTEK